MNELTSNVITRTMDIIYDTAASATYNEYK